MPKVVEQPSSLPDQAEYHISAKYIEYSFYSLSEQSIAVEVPCVFNLLLLLIHVYAFTVKEP